MSDYFKPHFDPSGKAGSYLRRRSVPQPPGVGPDDALMLRRIIGDSLVGERIADGDWVLYKVTAQANPGSLALVSTPAGDYVGFYWPQGDGTVLLKRANAEYADRRWAAGEVRVLGVVVMSGRDWLPTA
jgi:SOS-response transcriptional repressor LexA